MLISLVRDVSSNFPGSTDLSGFDRESWPKRDGKLHRRVAMGLRSFTTRAEQERMESQAGLRYSSLLQLPYFDDVNCRSHA
jgi:hypothetical protein